MTIAIQQVLPAMYQIAIPVPGPLRVLNAYAVGGRHGWTLVDCGYNTVATRAVWTAAFAELGIGSGAVEQIVVTHLHPDHLGAAGWLQATTGAPVLMHDREIANAERMWRPARPQAAAIGAFFARHGMPAATAAAVVEHHTAAAVAPLPPAFVPLAADASVRLGDREFQLLWMPGHTDGLAVFWCPAEQLLLGNDLVLNEITPNIQCLPNFYPDPLESFLASLARVARLPARLTLPGHRTLITDLAGRCRELLAHHHDRLAQVRRLVGSRGATGWQVAQGLFGRRMTDTHNTRFAMAETLSHLVYLERQGELVARDDGALVFVPAPR